MKKKLFIIIPIVLIIIFAIVLTITELNRQNEYEENIEPNHTSESTTETIELLKVSNGTFVKNEEGDKYVLSPSDPEAFTYWYTNDSSTPVSFISDYEIIIDSLTTLTTFTAYEGNVGKAFLTFKNEQGFNDSYYYNSINNFDSFSVKDYCIFSSDHSLNHNITQTLNSSNNKYYKSTLNYINYARAYLLYKKPNSNSIYLRCTVGYSTLSFFSFDDVTFKNNNTTYHLNLSFEK